MNSFRFIVVFALLTILFFANFRYAAAEETAALPSELDKYIEKIRGNIYPVSEDGKRFR